MLVFLLLFYTSTTRNSILTQTYDCFLVGVNLSHSSNSCYYIDNRKRMHFGWETRILDNELPVMENIEREDRTSVRSMKATNTGYTGLSLLHRLHSLYGFDIFKDIVYDGMHNIPLNVAKRHVDKFVSEGLIDPEEIDRCLENISWTPG